MNLAECMYITQSQQCQFYAQPKLFVFISDMLTKRDWHETFGLSRSTNVTNQQQYFYCENTLWEPFLVCIIMRLAICCITNSSQYENEKNSLDGQLLLSFTFWNYIFNHDMPFSMFWLHCSLLQTTGLLGRSIRKYKLVPFL